MDFNKFRTACAAKGTSPTALVTKLGLSSGNVTSWKNGGNPSIEILTKIAGELDVTTDYLLGAEQKKEVKSIKDQHPELYFYSNDTTPDIPHVTSKEQPSSQILTGKSKPKYFDPSPAPQEHEIRKANEQEMLQLFREISTREQLKEIARLEILKEKGL